MKSIRYFKLQANWIRIVTAVILVWLSNIACGLNANVPKPIEQVSESDLIGIWECHYPLYSAIELLIIKRDGTYQQVIQDSKGYLYTSNVAMWHLEPIASGRIFIKFEEGRYFPAGLDFANLLGKDPLNHNRLYDFYDPVDGGSRYMDNELLLEIIPSKNEKGIALEQFPTDIDSGREYFSPVEP